MTLQLTACRTVGEAGVVDRRRERVRYRIAQIDSAGPGLGSVLVATPLNNLTFDPALILRAMGVVAPLVVLLAYTVYAHPSAALATEGG